MNQAVLEEPAQAALMMGQPIQDAMMFPQTLDERYQPQSLDAFIGLQRPKRYLSNLIANPKAVQLLLIGPPGNCKSVAGMVLAKEVGSLIHISAQKCDVASIDKLAERLAYSPPTGDWWVVLVDEVDQGTEKAQLQLLSKMDGTAALVPTMGGGFVRGEKPRVIWVFTCNGKGEDGTKPPPALEPRFLDRCMKLEFTTPTIEEMAQELERVWKLEGGEEVEDGYFEYIARGNGLRGALMKLETDLMAGPRPVVLEPLPEVRTAGSADSAGIADEHQAAAREALGEQGVVWQKDGRFRAGIYSSDDGRWVEDGKLIIGTGSSAAGAVRDAVKRKKQA